MDREKDRDGIVGFVVDGLLGGKERNKKPTLVLTGVDLAVEGGSTD